MGVGGGSVRERRKYPRPPINGDDEDEKALIELQREASRRMSDETTFAEFYRTEVQERVNDPKRLRVDKPLR